VNGGSAVLNGLVNPENLQTTYWFKYSPNQDMSGATTTGSQSAGSGGTGTAVSQPVTGLQPNASYYFQVVASNTAGTKTSSMATFVTSAPPLAITQAAHSIGTTSTVLAGSVNPQNSPTTYLFKYSPNADMSGALPLPAIPADAGSDNAAHVVSQPLAGLAPGTTYYFMVVATNVAAGVRTTIGSVVSFTTLAPPAAVITTTTAVPPPPPQGGGPQTRSKPQTPSYVERVPSRQTLNSLLVHGLTIRVRCAARCSLTAELLLPVTYRLSRHRLRTTLELLGKVSKTLSGDRTLQFTITLSRAGRRQLLNLSRVVLTLQLSAIAPGANAHTAGAATTTRLRVTLVRSKPPYRARR
jgi:hypothetical protein